MTRHRILSASIALALVLGAASAYTTGTATSQQPTAAKPAAAAGDAAQRYDELVAQYEEEQDALHKRLDAAKDDEESIAIWDARSGVEYVARFRAIAESAPGTDTAAKAWLKAVEIAIEFNKPDEARNGVNALVNDHIQSPELAGFANAVRNAASQPEVQTALRTVMEKSPHATARAPAMYAVASQLAGSENATDAQRVEAHKLLEKLAADYKGVKSTRGSEYAKLAERYLFELDHLQIGQVAPDFEATDPNGQKFKLSDYRGKVVVVDFWGFW